jgi:hypothetical protein
MSSIDLHYDNVNRYLVLAASPYSASARLHTSWKEFFSPYIFKEDAKDILQDGFLKLIVHDGHFSVLNAMSFVP